MGQQKLELYTTETKEGLCLLVPKYIRIYHKMIVDAKQSNKTSGSWKTRRIWLLIVQLLHFSVGSINFQSLKNDQLIILVNILMY